MSNSMSPRTLAFAYQKHHGQMRHTGESFIHHPVSVMERLQELGLRGKILECALLHDVCEDTKVTFEEVHQMFGKEIGAMVYFLTKTDKEHFDHTIEGHDLRLKLYIEKLTEGIREYPEVMLIKMSDQIDNLMTLHIFPPEKQSRIVYEMKQYFLPLYKTSLLNYPKKYTKAALQLYQQLEKQINIHT